MSDRGPIFVVGVGRSGTSLIQSMLSAHSQVAFPPETAFVRRYMVSRRLERVARAKGIAAVVDVLEKDCRFCRLGISARRLVSSVAEQGALTDLGLYRSMLDAYAARQNKRIVGDKDPRLIEYIRRLSAEFPRAHVVHIIRDPRDVLLSKRKAAWSRDRWSIRHMLAARIQMKMGRRDGARYFGRNYHEIIYEALLEDPVKCLRSLCSRIGIEYESEMLDFSEAARSLVAHDELAWKRNTLQPLLRKNTGKWIGELSEWEVAAVETVCADAMLVGRYQSSNATTSLRPTLRGCLRVYVSVIALLAAFYNIAKRFDGRRLQRVVM